MLLGILCLATIESYLGESGNYHKAPFVFGGVDILIFQKILFCFFFMVFLHRFESYNNQYIHYLASTSFTVFFAHPFLISIISSVERKMGLMPNDSWGIYLLSVIFVVSASVCIAITVKKTIPKFSRYLTGY